MTGELIRFEGKEVRAIEQDGEVWLPLADLAEAIGYDRTSLPKHLDRNSDFFDGCSRTMDILSHDGTVTEESEICINEIGLYLLLARLSKGKIKNPDIKLAITRFRKSVPNLIQKYRKKEIIPTEQKPQIKDEISRAKMLAQETGGDPRKFMEIALNKCGMSEYSPALESISVVRGSPGWYNVTELIEKFCTDPLLTPKRLNWYLKNNPKDPERRPFQEMDENGIWRLTDLGKEHGKEYWYKVDKTGHEEIRIVWQKSILFASGLLKVMPESQIRLPERAES